MWVEFCRFTSGIMKKACGFWRNSDNLQGAVELQFFGNMRVRFCGSQKSVELVDLLRICCGSAADLQGLHRTRTH